MLNNRETTIDGQTDATDHFIFDKVMSKGIRYIGLDKLQYMWAMMKQKSPSLELIKTQEFADNI